MSVTLIGENSLILLPNMLKCFSFVKIALGRNSFSFFTPICKIRIKFSSQLHIFQLSLDQHVKKMCSSWYKSLMLSKQLCKTIKNNYHEWSIFFLFKVRNYYFEESKKSLTKCYFLFKNNQKQI